MAPWISLGLVTGYLIAPLPTRAVTTVFSTVALADLLFHVHSWLEARAQHEKREVTRLEEAQRREGELRAAQVS